MFEDDDYIECGCEPDRFGYVGHQCPNCGTTIKRSEEPLEAHSEPDPEPDKPHPGHCPKCGQTWLLPEALGPGRARLQCSRAYCLSDNWLMDIEAVSTVPQVVAPWGRETVWVSDPALDNLELLSVTEARGRLVELLDSFPFVEDADRVHSTALLLQTFFRASIPGNTPIYLIGSQETGAGKSLLADTCLAPAFGFEMVEATALGGYRSTQARALIAALNKNPQAVKLDNVQYSLDLEELAQAVSGQRVAGVHLPAAPTWVMTAIRPKLKLGDQIAARCVFINLEDTEWTHDLAPIEELDRRRYAEAATSILRAWLDQGASPVGGPCGVSSGGLPSCRRCWTLRAWPKASWRTAVRWRAATGPGGDCTEPGGPPTAMTRSRPAASSKTRLSVPSLRPARGGRTLRRWACTSSTNSRPSPSRMVSVLNNCLGAAGV